MIGGSGTRRRRTDDWFGNTFAGFDQMRRQMEKMFEEQLEDMQTKAPKELVREYETPEGGKVREIGPIVYGYSATIGPDGKPRVREFGNVRPGMKVGISIGDGLRGAGERATQITAEREPLSDVITTDKEVKVVVELPGTNKENIKVNAYEGSVEVKADAQDRKYSRVVDIPAVANIDLQSVKSTFKNGLLEIVFKRKEKPKGKEVKVE
ncbi:MAG: Hsp20/alpha crystallin family protein [Nitrososphaeraceae archaeon]|nr:Hsp20/alpha crystallin family protein [Nitrososphaeraceae archaeon]